MRGRLKVGLCGFRRFLVFEAIAKMRDDDVDRIARGRAPNGRSGHSEIFRKSLFQRRHQLAVFCWHVARYSTQRKSSESSDNPLYWL
jgi:hypothetical protein